MPSGFFGTPNWFLALSDSHPIENKLLDLTQFGYILLIFFSPLYIFWITFLKD
jgi:hypothetical protein